MPIDSMELCRRVDSLLERATNDTDSFYEYAMDNEEIVKYAFLARAVVRGLIDPLPWLFDSISPIEEPFSEYVSQSASIQDDVGVDADEENLDDLEGNE